VRITHIPTKAVAQCQNERSQLSNRATAMKLLKSKLLELEEMKRAEEMDKERGEVMEIAWGSQIRSYVMQPYRLVKDHRTNKEMGNVDAVLDGDIDPFITAYLISL
jgi:peptide chain release factor 2